ncbi:MAG: pseudouridine synthase [Alcaligenaceae bacterium]|jgi:tRNA pseudouridine32 synthase / 23S rRNA pseudouridine746 synthase|nr:pseudouridine synthase [Alcaligenaceae bacterium]
MAITSLDTTPLPVRQGVAPSRVHLPQGPWPTLIDFLIERFPFTAPQVIRERLARGEIVDQDGVSQTADTTYQPNQWLWYYREVPDEAIVPFEIDILYRDERILVIDKPHFLASIPGGRYLRETALTRLRQQPGLTQLSPAHRLDRETAGVMLLTLDPSCRGAYQSLFQSREVQKIYEAVAPWRDGLEFPRMHESCLAPKATHFTMQEVPGEPNSRTLIELLRRMGDLALYQLSPVTGRKHQLRVHLSSLGIPICNDLFYPELQPSASFDNFDRPLQLLARRISFTDPYTGQERVFESRRTLEMAL